MNPTTYAIQTLGCPKNEADSDRFERELAGLGLRPAPAPEADLVVINTCGFIDAAKEESIDAILEATTARRSGAAVAVIGCLVERYRDELRAELPEVDLWCGLDRDGLLATLVERKAARAAKPRTPPPLGATLTRSADGARARLTPTSRSPTAATGAAATAPSR